MKRVIATLAILIAMGMVATSAFAATQLTQGATVSVGSVLSVEFAAAGATNKVALGEGTLNWPSADATQSQVYPEGGHVPDYSDVGLVCKYNGTGNWALKISFASGNMAGKLRYYMGQPYYNLETTDGTLGNAAPAAGSPWPPIPATPFTAYTSGSEDRTNVPNGTFIGISFALDPSGLEPGTPYGGTITYTIVGSV